MSHRALVAVRRDDGRYDLRYAHDGGADDRLDRLRTRGLDPPPDLREGPELARGLDVRELLADHLDPIEHEALVVVERDGEVVPMVVLPYVLATADGLVEWAPQGAAVALVARDGSSRHPAFVRGWFQGTAEVLGEAVDLGLLSTAEAFEWLEDAVHRFAGDRYPVLVVE